MTLPICRFIALCVVGLVATTLVRDCRSGTNGRVPADSQTRRVAVGREFTMKVGQVAAIEGAKLNLKFTGVGEDSRCPVDVTCVWAGNAQVLLEVTSGKTSEQIKLNSNARSQAADEGKYAGYKIKLIRVDPVPNSKQKIAAADYSATLVVEKA